MMSSIGLAVIALAVCASGTRVKPSGPRLKPVWDSLVSATAGVGCGGSGPSVKGRLAMVRRNLLEGLGLSKAPDYKDRIPWPHSPHLHLPPDRGLPLQQPSYQKIVLIPKESLCDSAGSGLHLQLEYNLPDELHSKSLTGFSVWLNSGWKGENSTEFLQYQITIDSCGVRNNSTAPLTGTKISLKEWLEIDMLEEFSSWLYEGNKCCQVSILVEGLESCSLQMRPETQPFLTIEYADNTKARRKRGRDCVQGMNDCCRENLHVSFRDLEWDKWIHHPSGFDAYYCRGSCVGPSTITVSANNHHSVLQKLRLLGKAESGSCCGPTKFSPLNIMVVYPNRSAACSTIQKMIVEECGCM